MVDGLIFFSYGAEFCSGSVMLPLIGAAKAEEA